MYIDFGLPKVVLPSTTDHRLTGMGAERSPWSRRISKVHYFHRGIHEKTIHASPGVHFFDAQSPFKPLQDPFVPSSPLKPLTWSQLEAPLKVPTLKPSWRSPLKAPLRAPFKPPWSSLQAPFKPSSSPLRALKPPSCPLQPPFKPPFKPPSSEEAPLKPPWSALAN